MSDGQNWRELIDGFAPGEIDQEQAEGRALVERLAEDPRLRESLERTQRLDRRIGRALHDVPVPPGLRARVEQQLALEPALAGAPTNEPQRARGSVWLRRTLVGGAMACLVVALLNLPREEEYNLDRVYADARSFFLAEVESDLGPVNSAEEPAPAGYRPSQYVQWSRGGEVTWRRMEGLFGRRGIAFDLVAADGVRATLYVVKLQKYSDRTNLEQILPFHPPVRPLTTENLATGAWQEGDLAYVLVVAGDERSYRRFMAAAGPLV
jgi:hypothetical protein